VIRGGEARTEMIALNRDDPASIDERFLSLKPALENAVKDSALLKNSVSARAQFIKQKVKEEIS
jgi:hypothetical protein